MKNSTQIIFFVSCFFTLFSASAQAPQKMSYQAVIRNASNTLVANTNVSMKISILQGSATGTVTYMETQNTTTNVNGLATIQIGAGTAVTGVFADIPWSNGLFFIKTETDPTGGTSYTITGTSQLMSVPYALYAEKSGNASWGLDGNFGTTTTNFIGTRNNNDVVFKRNDVLAGRIGIDNISFGNSASLNNTTGYNNAAFGLFALPSNTIGINNTAIGSYSLYSNTSGSNNTALGLSALYDTTGSYNIGIGSQVSVPQPLLNHQMSIGNVIYGADMTSAANGKIGIGVSVPTEKLEVAGKTKTTNLQVTNGAGVDKILTSDAMGNASWQTKVDNWTSTGTTISNTNTGNVGIGTTTPSSYGGFSGKTLEIASYDFSPNNPSNLTFSYETNANNRSIGSITWALKNATTPEKRTSLIASRLENGAPVGAPFGNLEFFTNNGTSLIKAMEISYLGIVRIPKLEISTNAGAGKTLMSDAAGNATWQFPWTNAAGNTFYGTNALAANTTGFENTAIGINSLVSNTSGNYNTAIGKGALNGVTTGLNNTGIGDTANVPNAAGNNQVRVGNTFVTYAGIQVPWSITSDSRWKSDIKKSSLGLDFINKLNPVSYTRKNDDSKKLEYGFIAQEMDATLNQLDAKNNGIITKDDAGMYSVRYNDLLAPMVKAIQEQQIMIEQLKKEIELLKK